MGHREDLVRQRLEAEDAANERIRLQREKDAAERLKKLDVQLDERLARVRAECERVVRLYESADWSQAELTKWLTVRRSRINPHFSLLARKRVITRRYDTEYAMFEVCRSKYGTISVRSDNQLFITPYYSSSFELLSFIGENRQKDSFDNVETYADRAEEILSALQKCQEINT